MAAWRRHLIQALPGFRSRIERAPSADAVWADLTSRALENETVAQEVLAAVEHRGVLVDATRRVRFWRAILTSDRATLVPHYVHEHRLRKISSEVFGETAATAIAPLLPRYERDHLPFGPLRRRFFALPLPFAELDRCWRVLLDWMYYGEFELLSDDLEECLHEFGVSDADRQAVIREAQRGMDTVLSR